MNSKKFIAAAKESGIEASEIVTSKKSSFSFELFKGELTSYSVSSNSGISARGIYKGQMGYASSEKDESSTIASLIEKIKTSASLLEKAEKPIIFKGSEKYHKKLVYNKALEEWKAEDKIALCKKIEKKIYALSDKVTDVELGYSESSSESTFSNSYGLNLKNKDNYFYIFAEVVVKNGDDIKSYGKIFFDNDPKKFDFDEFTSDAVNSAIAKLGGTPIKAKKYKAVLSRDVVSNLMNALIGNASAESVQKHSSLLEGKLNSQVLSKKITIDEKPLSKNCFFTYFDDEGVASKNKRIFDKGVLKTYLYNLETAAKDGVESTGNGSKYGGKISIGWSNLVLKPGKLSEEELIAKIGNGVYISDISGLHAGLNSQSGDFSLEAQGFHVENGKKTGPLTLITVAGNLYKVFSDVIAVGNNSKLDVSSNTCSSIAIRGLKVSS